MTTTGAKSTIAMSNSGRIWFAQSIRGVAALMVVWSHFIDSYLGAPDDVSVRFMLPKDYAMHDSAYLPILDGLTSVGISAGTLGVALFFLTSGFVIPFSLQRRTLSGFFLRRFFRIYPIHWLALAIVLGIKAARAVEFDLPFPYTGMNIVLNLGLINSYLGHPYINGVTWTLVIEELFYFGAALLAWRTMLDRRSVLLAFAVVSALACSLLPLALPILHHRLQIAVTTLLLNVPYVIYILIGVGFHWWLRGRWTSRGALTVGALLWIAFVWSLLVGHLLLPSELAPYVSVPGSSVLTTIVSCTIALALFGMLFVVRDRVPYSRVVDWLAKISYPMYAMHAHLGIYLLYGLSQWTGNFWLALAGTVIPLLVLMSVIHVAVEDPINEFGRRLSARLGWEGGHDDRRRVSESHDYQQANHVNAKVI